MVNVLQFCPQCKNIYPSKTLPNKELRKFIIKDEVDTVIYTEVCAYCARVASVQED